jgi:uncharacterized membrane protein YqjE
LSGSAPGLLSSLRGFATTSVGLARTRLELLKVEAQEEVGRIAGLLAWTLAAVLLAMVGLTFVAVFFTVLLWDSQRMLALGVFAALFLGAAAIAIGMAMRLARQSSQLFAASLAELRRDQAMLAQPDE